jgi:hypothetical protein
MLSQVKCHAAQGEASQDERGYVAVIEILDSNQHYIVRTTVKHHSNSSICKTYLDNKQRYLQNTPRFSPHPHLLGRLTLPLPRRTPALPSIRPLLLAPTALELESRLALPLFGPMSLKHKSLFGLRLGHFAQHAPRPALNTFLLRAEFLDVACFAVCAAGRGGKRDAWFILFVLLFCAAARDAEFTG